MIVTEKEKLLKEEKVLVECDFKISAKCKGKYEILYKNILKFRANNNGKDRCSYCANTMTKSGKQNYNFKFNKNENYFEKIDSEIKAYLLGWVAGDGCIKKDALQLEIHEKDSEILELFKSEIAPEIELYKRKDARGKNTICWKIHSVQIVKDLLNSLNLEKVGKKSHNISLPNLPENLLWHFIRGWFDSDGSIFSPFAKGTRPTASICSMSDQIKKEFMLICDKLNIKYTLNTYSIVFKGLDCLTLINNLYKNATFMLKRKYENALVWKTWIPNLGTSARPRKKSSRKYTPISEEHKEKIRLSNSKNKRKLSLDEILEIKKMADTKSYSQKEIGKKFNISQSSISDILSGKTYNDDKKE